jgi:hypothetical protein
LPRRPRPRPARAAVIWDRRETLLPQARQRERWEVRGRRQRRGGGARSLALRAEDDVGMRVVEQGGPWTCESGVVETPAHAMAGVSSAWDCTTSGTRVMELAVWRRPVRLISHQPAVDLSHNKSTNTNRPAVLFSQNKSASATSHVMNRLPLFTNCFSCVPSFLRKLVVEDALWVGD